jgi:hypothetical protein
VDDGRILETLCASAVTGEGIPALQRALFELVPPVPALATANSGMADFLVYRPRPPARRRFRILRTDRGFRVVGTPPAGAELEQALRAAGAKRGAEIEIGDEVLELT